MRQSLFREEALESSRDKLLGEVSLHQPLSVSILTGCAAFVAIAVIAFVIWGEYTRKAHVSGYLAPSMGLIKVYAPEPGTLIEKHVREGQVVKRGDRLFVLSTERSSRETPEAQSAAISKLQERRDSLKEDFAKQGNIAQIEQRTLQERIMGMEAEAVQIGVEINLQKQRVEGSREVLGRFRRLQATQSVSDLQAQEKQQELLDQQYRLQELERQRLNREREIKELRLQVLSDELKAKNHQAAIGRDVATLEQQLTEYESRRNLVITAPRDGIVTTILAERGQVAQTTSPLLSILPEGATLEAQLLIPSRAIGFIAPGQSVAVRYQAFPYQRFGSHKGEVREIAKTLIRPNEVDLPVALNEPVYRVTVALASQTVEAYRQDIPLQSGMLLDADVSLDHRRLIEWVFDPLFSVTGKL
jgi:membrane fusion protein